jgi:DNA-binding transcriptional ArsR family regulator
MTPENPRRTDSAPASRTVRQVRDIKVLSALAHPVRRRLMDSLVVDGPSTASLLAERIGEAVGNVSHHLKVLAAVDLVTEVPELARDRRERWWRRSVDSLSWTTTDFADQPGGPEAATAAESLNLEHAAGLARAWMFASEADRGAWPLGPFSTDKWMRLNDAELAELYADLRTVLDRWSERSDQLEPDEQAARRPVFVFAYGMPATP